MESEFAHPLGVLRERSPFAPLGNLFNTRLFTTLQNNPDFKVSLSLEGRQALLKFLNQKFLETKITDDEIADRVEARRASRKFSDQNFLDAKLLKDEEENRALADAIVELKRKEPIAPPKKPPLAKNIPLPKLVRSILDLI